MKKKVLLISPNSEDDLDASLISYPMALGYLATYAEKAGWNPLILDCYCLNWENTKKKILEIFEKNSLEVIGINCITMNRIATYKTIDLVKKISPKTKIVVGGVHPTIFPSHFLINHSADIVVLHEGEETFEEILTNLEKGKSFKKIKGIAYAENGKIKKTSPRPQISNLNEMPFMNHDYFLKNGSTHSYFFSSRGCPNNCTFCSSSVHWGRSWRPRNPKNVVDEIEGVLKKYPSITEIRFMDDTFTLDNQRVIEICKEMIKRKINVKWRCSGRVFPLSAEMIRWMEKSGCIMISFGVESGSKKLLKDMGKNQTPDQIYHAFKTVYENSKKISPEMFIILGFPGENDSTVEETINLIKKVIKISKKPLILTAARMLEIYPGTRLYELAKKRKMIEDDYWLTNPETPLFKEQSASWIKNKRNKILFINWTSAGIISTLAFLIKKKAYSPKKIYNVIRPYLKRIN